MALDIGYLKKYIGYNDNNSNIINEMSRRYSEQLSEAISTFQVLINSDRADTVIIDGVTTKALIDYNSEFTLSKLEKNQKIIQTKANEIHEGSYVEIADYNDNSKVYTYLVTEKESSRQGHEYGYMTKCNNHVTFINRVGKVIELPCILENRILYSDGLSVTKSVILEDGKRLMTVAKNKDTEEFYNQQRFIFNHNSVFCISSEDDYTNVIDNNSTGLLHFILVQNEERIGLDDMTNNLANQDTQKIITLDLQLTSKQLTTSETYQINPIVKSNDTVLTEELIYASDNESIATVSNTGLITANSNSTGSCNITVSLKNNTAISKTISINVVSAVVDNYTIEISVNSSTPDVLKYGQTLIYTANIYNNGILDTSGKSVVWSLSDVSKVTKVSETGTTITLKGKITSGNVILSCVGVWDSGVTASKLITFKSLTGI